MPLSPLRFGDLSLSPFPVPLGLFGGAGAARVGAAGAAFGRLSFFGEVGLLATGVTSASLIDSSLAFSRSPSRSS